MTNENKIPLLEEILDTRRSEIGDDFEGYKNHVYRMVNYCFALRECSEEERKKIIIAGCFHDIGIWTGRTVDYLPPSIEAAKHYLKQNTCEQWIAEIELMIDMHHKLTKYQGNHSPLIEVFRQGDLVDFSLGFVKCGLPKAVIKSVKAQFPNAGFHKRLVQLEARWLLKHPLNPFPILKW